MLWLAKNTPLPPVPYPHFRRHEIGSSVVIGYPITNNERADLLNLGALVLSASELEQESFKKKLVILRTCDLVCIYSGIGQLRRRLIRAEALKLDPQRFCRILVTQDVATLVEMLSSRKFDGKSTYIGDIAVGRA